MFTPPPGGSKRAPVDFTRVTSFSALINDCASPGSCSPSRNNVVAARVLDDLGGSSILSDEDGEFGLGRAGSSMGTDSAGGVVDDAEEKITIGICCMAKKFQSDTMQAMISQFESYKRFRIVPFREDLIINQPVTRWPKVDVMISFFSSGFPLDKAVAYAQRHPDIYFLTHPASQRVLLDRRDFYSALRRNNVPMVNSLYCSRDGYRGEAIAVVEENVEEEWVAVNDIRIYKPFVEKPVDSEDHNVYIYYDRSRGGGCRKLFRKKENQSSEFDPGRVLVRRDGSYLYEEYVETSGMMDVKCYTVGPNFVFAEQRKAPAVDGVVLRSASGKEVRQEVELTPEEMMVARKVIKVFRQMVCGFDILRDSNSNKFFVCDVNGWSFVKNNRSYVEHATEIMRNIFTEEVRKRGLHRVYARAHDRFVASSQPASQNSMDDCAPVSRELVGIVGVLRHADRTPKQKVKIVVNTDAILELIFDGRGSMKNELVFKSGHPTLDKIQAYAQIMLDEISASDDTSSRSSNEVTGVISDAQYRSTSSSITLKHLQEQTSPTTPPAETSQRSSPPRSKRRDENGGIFFSAQSAGDNPTHSVVEQLRLMVDVLSRKHEGLKVQIRPEAFDDSGRCIEALLICKWGGWLTEAGHKQAEMLGNHFIRRIFGGEPSAHCISRDQLAISTNNERRVIFTGLDFARCLIKDKTLTESYCVVNEHLLGSTKHAKDYLDQVAAELKTIMHVDTPEGLAAVMHIPGIRDIVTCPVLEPHYRTPRGAMETMLRLMRELVDHIPHRNTGVLCPTLYRDEPVHLMHQRWSTLTKAFYNKKTDLFDTTKITDIFDYVSYDVCYNQEALSPLDMYPLFTLGEVVSAFCSDSEYGIAPEKKKISGALIASHLIDRICSDLRELEAGLGPRSRLYFTSESHVMGLRNILYQSGERFHTLEDPMELHFLTHFVFKLYRYNDTGAMQVECHFSSGMDKNMFGIVQEHHVDYTAVTPMIRIHNDLTLEVMERIRDDTRRTFTEYSFSAVSPSSSGVEV